MTIKKFEWFTVINNTVLLFIALLCVLPFVHMLAISTSDGLRVVSEGVYFWPKQFNIEAYKYILGNPRLNIVNGLINSFSYTIAGTLVALALTFTTAFALSRKRLRYRYAIMLIFAFTWIFEAGIIPTYLVIDSFGLVNTFWVMIIPQAINTFYLIVTRSFLDTMPVELEESAFMDGANDFRMMTNIFLPLSKPVLATVGVFYSIHIWNQFLFPLIYLRDSSLHPIQLVLYHLVVNPPTGMAQFNQLIVNGTHLLSQNIKAAAISITLFPILFVYPYAQKYFTKGFLIGSLKG